jgi:hypothetical protein
MKVLLLHGEDEFSASFLSKDFDLIVDFARAPRSTYEHWSRRSGCPTISLYDFAEEVEDLYATKKLLQSGMELMVDQSGIDWWDLLSVVIVPGLQNAMLISKLADYLGVGCELHASRSFPLALGLQHLVKTKLEVPKNINPALRKVQHYFKVFSELDISQLYQVAQDKFDREHNLRRRVASCALGSNTPVFLLPSAYINVSRIAASTAEMLPDQDFLLVCARASGKLRSLPKNVRMASLDSYFAPADKGEVTRLMKGWEVLKRQLISSSKEFELVGIIGAFRRMPSLLGWALALRTAWTRVFEMEHIAGCLCADDTNPYSRIPLILAKQKAIPNVALHHGALDLYMAVKKQHADFYLAKSAMEHDYLLRRCRVEPERLVGPTPTVFSEPTTARVMELQSAKNWLVFFTEPYQAGSWRVTEVYRELLPRLIQTAFECRLKLVFKLHPFESAKGHMRMLQKHLSREQVHQMKIIAGSPSPELWRNTRAALTVESTTALECAALGIPVFFCAWLRHYHGAYLEQYSRFGFGHVLESAAQLANVPQLLRSHGAAPIERESPMTVEPQLLRELLTGKYAPKIVVEA